MAVKPSRTGRVIPTVLSIISGLAFAYGALLWQRRDDTKIASARLAELVHDSRVAFLPGDSELVRSAVTQGWSVIAGYGLVLAACAVIYQMLTFSAVGRRAIPLVWGIAVLAVAANAIENTLLYLSLAHPGLRFWVTVAAATKWAAFVAAALVVAVTAALVTRLAKSYMSQYLIRRRSDLHSGRPWWTGLLAPLDIPQISEHADADERAWHLAYNVPGSGKHAGGTALCLSGGGVRSACVAMGAMQVFSSQQLPGSDRKLLDDFSYIISVSGGGFSAGARLLAVQPPPRSEGLPESPETKSLPISARFAPGSPEFNYLRRHSSYIADTVPALLMALAQVVRNLLASLAMLFSSAILIGWLAGWLYAIIPIAARVPGTNRAGQLIALNPYPPPIWVALLIILGAALLVAAGALIAEWRSVQPEATRWKERLGTIAEAIMLYALMFFILVAALPQLLAWCSPITPAIPEGHSSRAFAGALGGAAAIAVVQLATAVVSMVRPKDSGSSQNDSGLWSWIKKMLPPSVLQLLLTTLTLTMLAAVWFAILGTAGAWVFNYATHDGTILHSVPYWKECWLAVVVVALFLGFCDVTSLSLHPFYRTRIARAFAVRRVSGSAQPYPKTEPTWLDTYGRSAAGGPEFVFAAAAAVSGERKPGPGQNVVSFVLGADHIGGPALGWLRTAGLRQLAPARIQRDLTVQAAMAISGAAFASSMGRQTSGIQALLAASGARLGTWLPNPVFVGDLEHNQSNRAFPKALPSVRGASYFYRELFGINKSDARLVQVTDGGHYENLGLVEALRRRCRLIYCIDGGGDTPPLLSGLADATRLARSELGVEISPYPVPSSTAAPPADQAEQNDGTVAFSEAELAPGSGTQFPRSHPFERLNGRLTAGAVLRAKITYPAAAGLRESTGILILAKATLWQQLPDWVLTHAASKGNGAFPHDSTENQWFTEAQFDAYIEVGRLIATEALRAPYPADLPAPRNWGQFQ